MLGTVLYLLSMWGKKQTEVMSGGTEKNPGPKSNRWFRSKIHPRELWAQVYETDNVDEARSLQARLQEEEIECIIYEQGKKDIHGNAMSKIGMAVPKTSMPHSQRIISRMPS